MNMMIKNFPEELQLLRSLCQTHQLRLDLSDDRRALLVGQGFAISITVDREGVRYWYVDAAKPPILTQYALDFYVVRKRKATSDSNPVFSNNSDRVRYELRQACYDLEEYAVDVLAGNRNWTKDYEFGTTNPEGDYRNGVLETIWQNEPSH